MYKKLSVKDRMDYMSMYKKAYPNSSYRDMVESYNDLDKYPDGGSTGPHRTYNINDIPTKQLPPSSETVQTQYQKPENPYLKGNLLDYRNNINAEEKAKRDYAESIRLAQEQILKDKTKKFINSPEGKKYLEEGVNNSINNPVFKAVTYATPIGTVVGGIEGIANLAPDLYNNNYKKAIIDAASMIPLVGKGIPNLYKYNPWAFKPNPEAYYRMIGKEGYADALESGVIRPPQYHYITPQGMPKVGEQNVELINGQLKQRLNFPQYEEAYYNAQFPLDKRWYPQNKVSINPKTGKRRLTGYEGPYMVEVTGNPHLFENAENVAAYTGPNASQTVTYSKEFIPTNTPGVKFYKEDWLRGYKPVEVPGQVSAGTLPPPVQSGLNPLAIADQLTPMLPHPMRIPLMGATVENMGPFTGSPLNFIPGYGVNLGRSGSAFRKFGNTMEHVMDTKTLSPKGGAALRMGKDQIVNEGNWAALEKPDENYKGVFAAQFDFNNPGTELGYVNPSNRNGVLIATKSGEKLVDIPIQDEGLSFHRRLPFSNRYIPIDKQKLLNDKFQWSTQGGHLQSLLEKHGYGLGYAGWLSALGYPQMMDAYKKYAIDPIKEKVQPYLDKYLKNKKQGGVIKDDRGQWAHPGEIKVFNLVPPAIGTSLYLKSQQNNKE